jgi:hypothetical protein
MKLYSARNRPSHRNNKQKRRWYKKVRWTYSKISISYPKATCRGSIKFGTMYVTEVTPSLWKWSVSAENRNTWYRLSREGTATSRILAQRRALDACRKLVGLEYEEL